MKVTVIQDPPAGYNWADRCNLAAKEATGDYLLFLQSTDRLVASLDEIQCDAPWFYGRTQIVDNRGKPLISFLYYPHKRYRLRRENMIPLSATFISRELFWEVGGFRTDLKWAADYDLFFRLAKRFDPIAIPDVIAQVQVEELTYHEKIARIDEAHRVRREYVKAPHDRLFGYRTWQRQRQRARG